VQQRCECHEIVSREAAWPRRVIDTAGLSSVHGTAICAGICPLSIAIPFTATEVRRLRVLGVRNQERSETIRSLAGYPS
jgi:hypothetical protein